MNKIIGSLWFKVICLILINSCLLLDIAWAGGAELNLKDNSDTLAVPIEITHQVFNESFNKLYGMNIIGKELVINEEEMQRVKVSIPQDGQNIFTEILNLFNGKQERNNVLRNMFIIFFLASSIFIFSYEFSWAGDRSVSDTIWLIRYNIKWNFIPWVKNHYITISAYVFGVGYFIYRFYKLLFINKEKVLNKLIVASMLFFIMAGYSLIVYWSMLLYAASSGAAVYLWMVLAMITYIIIYGDDTDGKIIAIRYEAGDQYWAGGTQYDSAIIVQEPFTEYTQLGRRVSVEEYEKQENIFKIKTKVVDTSMPKIKVAEDESKQARDKEVRKKRIQYLMQNKPDLLMSIIFKAVLDSEINSLDYLSFNRVIEKKSGQIIGYMAGGKVYIKGSLRTYDQELKGGYNPLEHNLESLKELQAENFEHDLVLMEKVEVLKYKAIDSFVNGKMKETIETIKTMIEIYPNSFEVMHMMMNGVKLASENSNAALSFTEKSAVLNLSKNEGPLKQQNQAMQTMLSTQFVLRSI